MALVLGVHGISQEQRGPNQLRAEWLPALADGMQAATGGREVAVPQFDLCFYGDSFLPAHAQGAQPADLKGSRLGRLAVTVSEQDVGFLADVVDEVEDVLPDLGPALGVPRVSRRLQTVAGRLARRMKGGFVLQFLAVLQQVRRYLEDQQLAEEIRLRVLRKLDARPAVVVAHSLGTVVILDTLSLNPEYPLPTLVTLGSPLAFRAVHSRLRHAPGPVEAVDRWVNVYDPGDPVAAAGRLSRIWSAAEDFTVHNGSDPHAARAYLSKQVVGQAVLDAMHR